MYLQIKLFLKLLVFQCVPHLTFQSTVYVKFPRVVWFPLQRYGAFNMTRGGQREAKGMLSFAVLESSPNSRFQFAHLRMEQVVEELNQSTFKILPTLRFLFDKLIKFSECQPPDPAGEGYFARLCRRSNTLPVQLYVSP